MPAQPDLRFPDLAQIVAAFRDAPSEHVSSAIQHNANLFRRIHGGLGLVREHDYDFDPRPDYWRRPERRLVVAYFAQRWHRHYAPPAAMRQHALAVFRHFSQGRTDGLFSWFGVDYETMGGWPAIADVLIEHARKLPDTPAFQDLARVWGIRESAGQHLATFLEDTVAVDDWPATLEPAFAARLPWFPYLDAQTVDDLADRQRFFFGLVNLFTATNAFHAAAMVFAPVLQNTKTRELLAPVLRWAAGESPETVHAYGYQSGDDEPRDITHYRPISELYGFLHLHQAPFINNRTQVGYEERFGNRPELELAREAGKLTRAFLAEHPDAVSYLNNALDALTAEPIPAWRWVMEGLDSVRVQRATRAAPEDRIDHRLNADLNAAAAGHIASLSEPERALIVLHLLVDADLYGQTLGATTVVHVRPPTGSGQDVKPMARELALPPALQASGERALSYLHAGLHVLFAGAPGTGKTTLAQFVGHAWNQNLEGLADTMALSDAPLTTVGNSAWSPFHTIGGLMPRPDGGFQPHQGIFIEPDPSAGDVWRLRSGAIVLDEMNRADLDRCIGELYPLLSGSVDEVHPAGIPGVRLIRANERFRLIATVNDATIDDIVFPISEGLARRFQRIELPGGSEEDLADFLAIDKADADLREAANAAISALFAAARIHGMLTNVDEVDRLRIGAGYFSLLRKWLRGDLRLPPDMSDQRPLVQAGRLLLDSLASLRDPSMTRLVHDVEDNLGLHR